MKKIKFSKFIVAAVIILNIIFIVAVLFAFLKTSNEPITLVECWFSFRKRNRLGQTVLYVSGKNRITIEKQLLYGFIFLFSGDG